MSKRDDFASWPAPPTTYTAALQWNHRDWKKLGEEQYVYAREVRESFDDCQGVWSAINEECNVPKLLDRTNFIKYCYYYMEREDLYRSGHPEDYVPLDYEKDQESRDEWRKRQIYDRFHKQYCEKSAFEEMFESDSFFSNKLDEGSKNKRKEIDVKSKKNQYYIKAVKSNRPDAIQALFAKGTSAICPNCLEKFDNERNKRRGVVYHAMENLYNDAKSREDALECLRLVCSLDGVDVNADTWYTSFQEGPPLWTAIYNLDAEAVQILLHAGARTSYPEVVGLGGQWCALLKPFEYKEKEKYGTALHIFVQALHVDVEDEEYCKLLQILLDGRESDTLVKAEVESNVRGETVLEMLTSLLEKINIERGKEDEPQLDFPMSVAALQNAQAKAEGVGGSSYQAILSSAELDGTVWAKITDLDLSMQASISKYIGIMDWVSLKETCKGLQSFPKPPSPQVDYHLIRFCVSDNFADEYFGFAKTMPALMEACKHVRPNMDLEFTSIEFEFIHIRDIGQPIIPLVRYPQSEHKNSTDFRGHLHPGGERHFGLKALSDDLPETCAVKDLLSMGEHAWPQEMVETDDSYLKGVSFDSDEMEGAFIWFKDLKPSSDIDLRHLWHIEGSPDEDDGFEECWEIWLNPNKANTHDFDSDEDATWVVCHHGCSLWDRYS